MGHGEPPASMGNAVGVIVASVLSFCMCWPLAIVGLVLGIVSAVMTTSNPKASKTCALIGWIMAGIGLLLTILLFVLYGGFGLLSVLSESGSGSYDTTSY
ncbi:hypothetical protein [Nocardiopsis sp. CNT-189]|uniref:hypothetical protein n=1 Tax=Nocardiopsis oceanisediminis TaxID=2816862 RepID=UPI003B3BDB38